MPTSMQIRIGRDNRDPVLPHTFDEGMYSSMSDPELAGFLQPFKDSLARVCTFGPRGMSWPP